MSVALAYPNITPQIAAKRTTQPDNFHRRSSSTGVFSMLSFLSANIQAVTNTVGLLLDIVGAWLVAWEVVRQFLRNKTRISGGVLRTDYLGSDGTPVVAGQRAEDTEEFKFWEANKYKRMKWGLGFLTLGFLLQLLSNWIQKLVV